MDFSENMKSPFMDSLDHGYYADPYLQDTNSPVLMGYANPTMSPGLDSINALQLAYPDNSYPSYANASTISHIPHRPITPPDGMGISPPNLSSYQLCPDPNLSPSQSSRASGSQSPPPTIASGNRVPRSHRFSPMVAASQRPAARAQRRKRVAAAAEDSDEEDDDFRPDAGNASSAGDGEDRKELVRKQRIESEQKRRDDLRDGYTRLKDILPASSQKSSKVVLLERATNQIKYLDTVKNQLERRLNEADAEMIRLRRVNDVLMERGAMQHGTTMAHF